MRENLKMGKWEGKVKVEQMRWKAAGAWGEKACWKWPTNENGQELYCWITWAKFPRWCSGKESTCQCRRLKRCRFNPWVGKILWSMKWQLALVFLPGKFHGQRSHFSSSVAQSCPTLWPHESQHTRPSCPSPTPRVHSNSCPSSRWCHPAISSSVVPFSSCPQSLSASGYSPMSQLFAWGGQSIGVSALASILPVYQDWSPSEWTGWSPRDTQEYSPTPEFKSINSSALSLLHSTTLTSIHDHWKNHSLD